MATVVEFSDYEPVGLKDVAGKHDKKRQNPDSSFGAGVSGHASGEAFALVRDDGRFFVRFSPVGNCQSSWSLSAAKLFPVWNLEPIDAVLARLGKTSRGWRVVRVAVCRGDVGMRVTRVDGRLKLVSVPFE